MKRPAVTSGVMSGAASAVAFRAASVTAALLVVAVAAWPSLALATPPPPTDPPAAIGPLIPVPPGCDGPPEVAVVFEGTLLAKDTRTGRFKIDQVRAGSSAAYEISGLIDVRLGDDVRFLHNDQHYVVGAAPLGPNLPLGSTVREAKPIFGGNAVIGLDESSLQCPTFDNPVQVLNIDGSPIDTGVLSGLSNSTGRMGRAVLIPALIAFAILVGLVLIRWFFTGMFRYAQRSAHEDRTAPRRERSHGLTNDQSV